jgi:hypothetical protein
MLDERGHVKIGDLGNSRFSDLRPILTMQIGAPLYVTPDGPFDALRRISFSLTPAVVPDRVAQYLALIDGPALSAAHRDPQSSRRLLRSSSTNKEMIFDSESRLYV